MGDEQSACSVLENIARNPKADPADLPLSVFKSITNNFSEDLQVGKGGFGVVYKGVLRNCEVAVKKFSQYPAIEDRSFANEVFCLMRCNHKKNIVRFLGYCTNTQEKLMEHEGRYVIAAIRERLLCFEFIRNGSLKNHLTDEFNGFGWHERYGIIKGVCQGLLCLHEEQNIVHMDLKPDNILLDQNLVPKISDFGLSRLFDKEQTRAIASECLGTRGYIAPEYLDHGIITFKSDIYSLGVIILEVMTGKTTQYSIDNVLENWKNRLQATSSIWPLEAYCNQVKRCLEIALNCMQFDSNERPTIGQIVDMLNDTETGYQENESVTSTELPEIQPLELRFPFKANMPIACPIHITNRTDERAGYQENESVTSTELLEIQPLDLRFPFKANMPIACPIHITNRTDQRVAFRFQPGNPERYFTEWLCGVVPSRSTYILTVTMKEQQQPPMEQDQFLLDQSRIMDDDKLKYIKQGEADNEFDNFFLEVEDMGPDRVHEQTLIVLSSPQAETSSEVISSVMFDKMVSMDVHPTNSWIVTGHFNGHVCIWDYETKELVNSIEVTKEQEVLTVKFIARKHWVVAGGGDHYIHVYNYNEMKIVKKFKALTEQITSLAIHPTEPYILAASYDFQIKLWDWENGWRPPQKFREEHSNSVMQVAFNAKDAKVFGSVSKDRTLKVWSVDSPRSKLTLTGHTDHVRCLDYFRRGDEQYMITGSDDCTAKIWDLQKKRCVETLEGHANRVSAVCCHPELPILMTGSRDGTVRLWNSGTFRLEGVLNFGLRKVHALACMKSSNRIVIGYSNGLAITKIDRQG